MIAAPCEGEPFRQYGNGKVYPVRMTPLPHHSTKMYARWIVIDPIR